MLLAHIAGLPIEETALSFGPVFAAGGGIAALRLRERLTSGRGRRTQRRQVFPPPSMRTYVPKQETTRRRP
jgi:hypothetical protein